jgi:hypothetical protein
MTTTWTSPSSGAHVRIENASVQSISRISPARDTQSGPVNDVYRIPIINPEAAEEIDLNPPTPASSPGETVTGVAMFF